jgi:hypothetical protein
VAYPLLSGKEMFAVQTNPEILIEIAKYKTDRRLSQSGGTPSGSPDESRPVDCE